MKPLIPTVLAIAVAAGLGLAVSGDRVAAQDGDADDAVRDCINIRQVDDTTVVDDKTVLFRMNDGRVYRNDLPQQCPQLRSEDRFSYRVMTSELCSVDVITVVENSGFELRPGASCGLGKFSPISKEAADELAAQRRRGGDER